MDTGSTNSLHEYTPLPTPIEEKKAETVERLSYVLGFIYAIFLIVLSTLVYISSPLINSKSPYVTLYILIPGLVILCILIVDVKLYTRKIRKQVENLTNKQDEHEMNGLGECQQLNDIIDNQTEVTFKDNDGTETNFISHEMRDEIEHIEHKYCFAQGRHAGSVYLKFGAAAFALGHLVHSVLLVVMHMSSLSADPNCIDVAQYIVDILDPIYSFLQLFFAFNYSNLIVVKHKTLARVAILHIMAGNVCLWILAVMTETQLALKAYELTKTNETMEEIVNQTCIPPLIISKIFDDYAPYLYPFTVEFNILIVGIFYTVWSNIGNCHHNEEETREFHHSLYARTNVSGEVNSPHALDIRINCRGSTGGLFTSLIIIVLLIASVILGFTFGTMDSENLQYLGYKLADSVKLGFHTTMLVLASVAFYKTHTLDFNKHPIPWLDDVLLYICVPAFFMETLFTVVATVNILNVVKFLDTIVMSLQMVVQTAFVIDGLRRCSNSRVLRRTKPGRELVLLLVVTNVSMWIMYSFSYKSPESKDERYVYYGKETWLILGHLTMPLIMFFRFHSSVCIADVWSYAYKPGIEDH